MTASVNDPVGLISNPQSGHNRDQFDTIRSRIDACPAIQHVITRSPADIPGALAQLRNAGVKVLAINGGDGTASAILGRMLEAGYFETPPAIIILPGGTANMNAGDVGARGSLKRAVERFCRWCETGQPEATRVKRALLRLERPGDEHPHYGMFLGGGAVIQGTEYAHREIHARGLRDDFSLALGTVRTVWGVARGHPEFSAPQQIGLRLDGGDQHRHDARILAVSTLERLAFGMRPFWGEGSGALRVTVMEQNCSRFARTFFRIIRGRPGANAVPEQGYFSHNADMVELELEGKLNLDGEILDTRGIADIRASRPLEFIRL